MIRGVLNIVVFGALLPCVAIPRPVWVENDATNSDMSVSFRASFDWDGSANPKLTVAASAVYRAFLNGEFVGWGPARAVYGFARIDKWPLVARKGQNTLVIEVAGYRFESFQYSGGLPFLSASVEAGEKKLIATPNDFDAVEVARRTEGPVYSRQRGFIAESYETGKDWRRWMAGETSQLNRLRLKDVESPHWLNREVPYPDFTINSAFKKEVDAQGQEVFRLSSIDSGFIGLDLKCMKPGRIVVEFDETLGTNGVIDLNRNGDPLKSWHAMYNRVEWDVKDAGTYRLETIEPYTLKYARVLIQGGAFGQVKPYVRRCRNPHMNKAVFESEDGELNMLFSAAKESLSQNAIDILTDCPSRERVGWLCDTFFSSEAAAWLSGDFSIEREYLLNFTRTDDFGKDVPKGAIPGFMPSRSGGVMPTYMMWYVIQCCAAAERLPAGQRRTFLSLVKPRIEGVLNWLSQFEKEGLLEDLPGWVFIEWSQANDYVKGVNYPSNMMWAYALERSGRLFDCEDWIAKAEKVRKLVIEQSYDGTVFHDQSLRNKDEDLVRNEKTKTETCQYYAYFTGLATPESFPSLWRMLVDELGPSRRGHEDMVKSDAFIGWLLRLELLSRHGEGSKLVSDMKSYYGKMAAESGTFWEFSDGRDSRCHAIGSYVAVLLLREAFGVERIDWARKELHVRSATIQPLKCSFPVEDGNISLSDGALAVPRGWAVIDGHHAAGIKRTW